MNKEKQDRGGSVDEEARPQGMAFAMRAEAEHILLDPAFRRSPTIAKLLRFLMGETLAGRAHLLKSYTVAVDGLDRSADFDAGDSYARVQMGRLRKMLQTHYAEHGPVDEMCLYLQPGLYSLRIGQLATAYPTLYRPLSVSSPVGAPDTLAFAPIEFQANRPSPLTRYISFLGILVLLVLVILGSAYWYRAPASAARLSPILELLPVDADQDEDATRVARIVAASFNDGLPRFKLSRIRILQGTPSAPDAAEHASVYRVHFQIEVAERGTSSLFLRLNDARSNTLIWSREVEMPAEMASVNDVLAPLMAEINGPHGVVATHSAGLYKDDQGGGYPCLLKYFTFLKTRDPVDEKLVAACFEKPVDEQRLRATILASRAFFAIDSNHDIKKQAMIMPQARLFAESALAADANDGSARFAMARTAFLSRDCVTARFYAHETVEANPYSPIFMAGLAAYAPLCSDPKSDQLLDRALLVANASDTDARLLLVLAAVAQGRTDRVSELEQTNVPRNGRHRLNYYLSESIIAASENRNEDAARYWQQFSARVDTVGMSPDEKLRRIIPSPELRRMAIAYLTSKGMFAEKK